MDHARKSLYRYSVLYLKFVNRYQKIRKQSLILSRRRGAVVFSSVQSSLIEKLAVALYEASKNGSAISSIISPIDSEGLDKDKLQKTIATLEYFGFVERKLRLI